MRLFGYLWASPASCVGLVAAAAACACGATVRRTHGVLEVGGGRLHAAVSRLPRPLRFEAITLGHVIVGCDHACLARLRAHERVHVAQYERWGVLFFPAYLASSALAWLRGGSPYRDNRFEREAFRAEGDDAARGGRVP